MASKNLAKQNFDVFFPLIKKTSTIAHKFVTNTKPLFPSYLFIGTWSETPAWKSINSTRGVSKAVTLDGTYRPICNDLIDDLKSRCDINGVLKPDTNIKPGDFVKIKLGPINTFVGEVEKIDERQRVWLLINLLQQTTRTSIPIQNIYKIG